MGLGSSHICGPCKLLLLLLLRHRLLWHCFGNLQKLEQSLVCSLHKRQTRLTPAAGIFLLDPYALDPESHRDDYLCAMNNMSVDHVKIYTQPEQSLQ